MKNLSNKNWKTFKNKQTLVNDLVSEIVRIANKQINDNNRFNIVITGGNSALDVYKKFLTCQTNWNKWHIYLSDERSVPIGHPDRNDQMINKVWLDESSIPKKNIHFIKAELGLTEARKEYEKELFEIDKFDVVLLSMGEDGHIASLFPNHKYPDDQMVSIEEKSPKPPKKRISMSYKRLNKSYYVFKLIIGKSKQRVAALLEQNTKLPIVRVNGNCEKIYQLKQ